MISNIETLEYIFNLSKRTKKPIIKIYSDGRVIGTDTSFATLNVIMGEIYYNISVPYIFISTELAAFMRIIQSNNSPLRYSKFGIESKDAVLENHVEMNYQFDVLYDKVMSSLQYPILYKEEDISKSIPEMFSLKASEGAKMYTIDKRFLLSSFNSIHPANKSDTVDLIIRDYDQYSFMAEFIIYKKKENYQLHEFLRFRKL